MASPGFAPYVAAKGWPNKRLVANLPARATGGLAQLYKRRRDTARTTPAAAHASVQQHTTDDEGALKLHHAMPHLAKRYRYLHTLYASNQTQIICAQDTYQRAHSTAPDGNTHLLVAIKILNAQLWSIGAQEFERVRRLRVAADRSALDPRIGRVIAHFELGAHFCIVCELLCELSRMAGGVVATPAAAAPAALPAPYAPHAPLAALQMPADAGVARKPALPQLQPAAG